MTTTPEPIGSRGEHSPSTLNARFEWLAVVVAGAFSQTLLTRVGWLVRLGLRLVHRLGGKAVAVAPTRLSAVLALTFLALVALNHLRSRQRETLAVSFSLVGLMAIVCVAIAAVTPLWISPFPFSVVALSMIGYWEWRHLHNASERTLDGLRRLRREAGASEPVAPLAGGRDRPLGRQVEAVAALEAQFLDARRFWSDLLATFQNPVLVLDAAGIVRTFNPAAADFARRFDVDLASPLSVQAVFGAFTAAQGSEEILWPLPEAVDPGGDGSPPTFKRTGVDSDARTYELSFTPTRSANGDHTGWIVHMLEVTLRISEVRERETAVKQREEALQFLSHDIRTPQLAILAVLGQADFQRAPTGLVHRIEQQARRTLNLAEGYVRLVQAQTDAHAWEAIDLGHVLEDATDLVWEHCQAAEVTVRLEPWRGEMLVLGNRALLSRAIVNLLDNAIKFSTPGKSVICRLSRAELGGRPAVACEIADKAGGMSPAQLANLFDRYATFRLSVSGVAGTGLGLALVRTVVERHGGLVKCESAQGVGSVFRIVLPCYDEHTGAARPPAD